MWQERDRDAQGKRFVVSGSQSALCARDPRIRGVKTAGTTAALASA